MDAQITQTFIGAEYGWDRLSEVKLDILQTNREASMRVINNPHQFPNADFDHCRLHVAEIDAFVAQYGPLLVQFA